MLNTIDGFVCIKGYTIFNKGFHQYITFDLDYTRHSDSSMPCEARECTETFQSGFDCPCDNNSLYLLCTFIDLCDLSIPEESLYREFLGVSVTA